MKRTETGLGTWVLGLGNLVGLSFLLFLTSPAEARVGLRETALPLRITVRVQNYAQVPPGTLAQAKRVAARVLEETGIRTTWLDCGGSAEGFTANTECTKPFASIDLLLRILPRSMAQRLTLTDSTFGFALQSTDERLAFAAGVFYRRVERLAEKLGFSRAQILGYIAAHEIGHLLLRTMVHSPTGIMRAGLSREDLLRPLGFTAKQAELIRAEVAARVKLGESAQPPASSLSK